MRNYETDVVVVAAGPAGLAAAISAAENGAKVIVLEKAPTTGGTGNMGMGPLGIGTQLQKRRLVGLTVEEAFKKHMDYTHWRVDARLVRSYYNKSADTIKWLEDMGVEWFDVARYFPGSEQTWHMVKPASGLPGPRAATIMFKYMAERAEELGVEFLLETPAQKILVENGRAVGVLAKDKSGEEIQVNAKAVIIATGGFGDNPEMLKQYTGYEWGKDLFSFRIPGIAGDGIKMAWEAGAADTEMNVEMIYGIPGIMDSHITDYPFRQPAAMWLNLSGERFLNEELTENTPFTGNAIARQPRRCAISIFDSSILKHYKKNGLDLMSLVHPNIPLDKFEEEIQKHISDGNPNVFIADSLEELAGKIGMNPDALKAAVDEYNSGCQSKEDFFDKKNKYLRPITGPKYYAGRFFPSAYGSLGGVRINYKAEVLAKEELNPIPGLYAAGTDACSIFGDTYVFILPGNTMGFALNSGRIAGESASEYVESL